MENVQSFLRVFAAIKFRHRKRSSKRIRQNRQEF